MEKMVKTMKQGGVEMEMPKSVKSVKNEEMTKGKEVEERRELVDSLDCIGMKPTKITSYLQEKKFTVNYRVVTKDLAIVRKKRKSLLYEYEARKTKADYIGTQKELLNRAIENKEYKTASNIADKILKARGVDIE